MAETRAQFKARLQAEGDGRWDAYQELYQAYLTDGMEPKEARAAAVAEFQPTKQTPSQTKSLQTSIATSLLPDVGDDEGERAAVAWVMQNAMADLTTLDPGDVPGPTALTLLVWVQQNHSNLGTFIRDIWTRLLPTRAQLDEFERFSDDGSESFDRLDELESAIEEDFAHGEEFAETPAGE